MKEFTMEEIRQHVKELEKYEATGAGYDFVTWMYAVMELKYAAFSIIWDHPRNKALLIYKLSPTKIIQYEFDQDDPLLDRTIKILSFLEGANAVRDFGLWTSYYTFKNWMERD